MRARERSLRDVEDSRSLFGPVHEGYRKVEEATGKEAGI